jgi:hypothetical protein
VLVSDAATGRRVKQLCAEGGRGQFSPDGRWLAVSVGLGGIQLWRVEGWQPAGDLPGNSCAFTHDGAMVATGVGLGEVRLVACDTGREVARLEMPDQTPLEPVAFTPDGATLIARAPGLGLLLAFDLRGLRAELKPLDLDWGWPDFVPDPAPADPAVAPAPWQVMGAD